MNIIREKSPLQYKLQTMKLKVLIFCLVVMGMAACTQRTCPTYAQNVTVEVEQTEANV